MATPARHAIPPGFEGAIPYLMVAGAAAAIGFYGDRSGTFADPFGHTWTFSTHKEDLTSEGIAQRAQGHG